MNNDYPGPSRAGGDNTNLGGSMVPDTNPSTAPDKANDRYPGLATQKLIEIYAVAPERLRTSLSDLSEQDLKTRPISGKWSIQEITIHLADSEIMGAVRFRQAITGSERSFSFYNQEIWCREFDYNNADQTYLHAAVDLFESLRRTTAAILQNLPDSHWFRTGYHPENGVMSVRQLLENYAAHSENHLLQITERRRIMGKPPTLTPLLPL